MPLAQCGVGGVPSYSSHSRTQMERGTPLSLDTGPQHSVLRFASAGQEGAAGLSSGKYLLWPGSDTYYFCFCFIVKD